MSWMGDWTWEQLKEEVDRGHKEFFERRGINPNQFDNDFLFGKSSEDKSRLSSSENDQPIQQSSREKNQNQAWF